MLLAEHVSYVCEGTQSQNRLYLYPKILSMSGSNTKLLDLCPNAHNLINHCRRLQLHTCVWYLAALKHHTQQYFSMITLYDCTKSVHFSKNYKRRSLHFLMHEMVTKNPQIAHFRRLSCVVPVMPAEQLHAQRWCCAKKFFLKCE